MNPENAFRISRWTGNDDDTTLYDLAAFLKSKIDLKTIRFTKVSCNIIPMNTIFLFYDFKY